MLRFRNLFILCLSILILGSTMFCTLANRLGIVFPNFMEINTKHSHLENRDLNKRPSLSLTKFMEGDFQPKFENYISDLVPMRSKFLLANAKTQRNAIEFMAVCLNYDTFPTFYGSKISYSRSSDRLMEIPESIQGHNAKPYKKLASSINKFASKHPDYRFFYFLPTTSNLISQSPSASLMSSPISTDYFDEIFTNSLSSDIKVMTESFASFEEYAKNRFSTDHHWNIDGAYRGYKQIATEMGFGDELTEKGERILFQDDPFYGSFARRGLMGDGPQDFISDFSFDLPEYSVTVNGKKSDSFMLDWNGEKGKPWSKDKFLNRYGYFHSDTAQIVLENKEIPRGESLLIVGDSYSNPMERLFLPHYKKVYVYDPRRAKITLSEFLEENDDVNDILFILSYSNLDSKSIISSIK